MSIQQTGPKGYELQYLGTVWITLSTLADNAPVLEVFVERKGGEDAEIRFTSAGSETVIEVQSKSEIGTLDLDKLSEWLSHFPESKTTGCLLERLLDQNQRSIVLIAGGRCADDASLFIVAPGSLATHRSPPIKPKEIPTFASKIAKAHGSAKEGDSRLKTKRLAACVALGARLNTGPSAAAEALQHVIVWEQVTEHSMTNGIASLLQMRFHIPPSECEDAIRALVDAVRQARDTACDLVSLFRAEIERRSADRMVREELHTTRGDEASLAATLAKERALLLTGRSRCGKTHTGRHLAQQLQDAGWAAAEGTAVQAAEEFLRLGPSDNRVFLLDDPLPGHGPFSDPQTVWRTIAQLVQRLTPGRRLIVTAKLEALREVSPAFYPKHLDLYGLRWYDLTITDRSFLLRYWEDVSRARGLAPGVVDAVHGALQTMPETDMPQAGQLRHLAFTAPEELARVSGAEELVRFARFNAAELAERLAGGDAATRRLCFALGLGGSISRDLQRAELAYLLQQTADHPALESDGLGIRTLILSAEPKAPTFPTYVSPPHLDEHEAEALRSFERRGYVYSGAAGQVRIAHPDYHETFQRVLLQEPPSALDALAAMARRGLGALDPLVGGSTVRWLARWWKEGAPDIAPRAVQLLLAALEGSLFPEVRHAARLALLARSDDLNEEDDKALLQNLRHSEDDSDSLVWHGEIAWLDRDPKRDWLSQHLRAHRTLPLAEVEAVVQRLKDPQQAGTVTASQCDAANTRFLVDRTGPVDAEALLAIMHRPEAFLRMDAAALLFRGTSDVSNATRERVFTDEDPVVIAAAVRSVLENWRRHTAVPNALRDDLLTALGRLPVAVALASALFDFGDQHSERIHIEWEHYDDTTAAELWRFWCRAACVVLQTLSSHSVWINSGRFFLTMKEACARLPTPDVIVLIRVWHAWAERQAQISPVPGDMLEFGRAWRDSATLIESDRTDLLRRAFSLVDTDGPASALQEAVGRWSELTAGEQDALRTLLRSARSDLAWLQAIVLTRHEPPSELVELISGRADFFALSPTQRMDATHEPLLTCCLRMACAEAGCQTTFGAEGSGLQSWREVLDLFLEMPDSPHFPLVVADFCEHAASRLGNDSDRILPRWRELLERVDRPACAQLFEGMLRESLSTTYAQLQPFWTEFFAKPLEPKERATYLDRIVECIEGISSYQRDIHKHFGASVFNELVSRMPNDEFVFNLLEARSIAETEPDMSATLLKLLERVYEHKPPRMALTHELAANLAQELGSPAKGPFLERIEAERHISVKRGSAQQDANRPYRALATGWVVQSWLRT